MNIKPYRKAHSVKRTNLETILRRPEVKEVYIIRSKVINIDDLVKLVTEAGTKITVKVTNSSDGLEFRKGICVIDVRDKCKMEDGDEMVSININYTRHSMGFHLCVDSVTIYIVDGELSLRQISFTTNRK